MRNPRGAQSDGAAYIRLLVAERHRLGLTQHDMAHAMGVSVSTVGEFETHMVDPRISTLLRYSTVLGWKLVWTPV